MLLSYVDVKERIKHMNKFTNGVKNPNIEQDIYSEEQPQKIKWSLSNIILVIRYFWHRFWYLFTYKTYGSYARANNRANRFFYCAIVFLVIGIYWHRFSGYSLFLFMLWLVYAFIITFRSKGLVKNAASLADYYNLKDDHLRIYDLVPFNQKKSLAKIAFTLFPEHSLIKSGYLFLKNRIHHEKQTYAHDGYQIAEVLKYFKKNPNDKDIDAKFYLCLPVDKQKRVLEEYQELTQNKFFMLVQAKENHKLWYKPSHLAYRINHKKYPEKWQLYEVVPK